MKKVMLIAVGALIFGVTATFAQDTTRIEYIQKEGEKAREQSSDQDMKGWTKVNSVDIPASLRTTLSGSQYRGWEKSTIYQNDVTKRYMVRIGEENPTTYYFDKEGKPVDDPGK